MCTSESGYINPRFGFTDTGYSSTSAYIYWFAGIDRRYYLVNTVVRDANIHEVREAVMNDFGDLVVLS